MAIFFTSGEKKKRAGIYQRYENVGTPPVAGRMTALLLPLSGQAGAHWEKYSSLKATKP